MLYRFQPLAANNVLKGTVQVFCGGFAHGQAEAKLIGPDRQQIGWWGFTAVNLLVDRHYRCRTHGVRGEAVIPLGL